MIINIQVDCDCVVIKSKIIFLLSSWVYEDSDHLSNPYEHHFTIVNSMSYQGPNNKGSWLEKYPFNQIKHFHKVLHISLPLSSVLGFRQYNLIGKFFTALLFKHPIIIKISIQCLTNTVYL